MSTRKYFITIVALAFTTWLLAGCGSTPAEPTTMPTLIPSPAATATVAVETGFITGRVHLASPPTPAMAVYAMDQATGLWAFTETTATDGEASYTLEVKPGSYQVFAFSEDANTPAFAGYATEDETTLAIIPVAAGQTVTDITVRPPGQFECGSMWGVPPAPDGRFEAISPSPDCLAAQAASGSYGPVSLEVCQTLQEMATQSLSLTFSLEASAPFTDPLTGETGLGCTLTAMATGMFFSDPGSVTSNLVNGFLGWEEQTAYQADGPTGSSTAMTRDMALMLILAEWMPSPEVQCPTDRPISECDLKPEQKLYTVQIRAAQK
jgi:hypothetical protein